MRVPRPWWWAKRGIWCVKIDGRRHNLGPDRDAATKKYHRLMASRSASPQRVVVPGDEVSVAEVCDRYILWLRANRSAATATAIHERLSPFAAQPDIGHLAAGELRPLHVSAWIDKHKNWNATTRRDRVAAVKQAFRWAVREGFLAMSPVESLRAPAAQRRDNPLTPAEFAAALEACRRDQSRDLLKVCWETGCRFQEITRVEARHLDGKRWVFPEREAKGKKRIKIVYLPDAAAAICARLAAKWPTGPIFRTSQGQPWNKYSVANMLARLAKRTGKAFCLTDLRHSFATEMVKAGVDPLTLAAIMGHVDGVMIARVYSHLGRDESRLFEQFKKREAK